MGRKYIFDNFVRDVTRVIPRPKSEVRSRLQELLDAYMSDPYQEVTRVEVIDENGRSYVNWDKKNKVDLSIQDDGKTLKLFIHKK